MTKKKKVTRKPKAETTRLNFVVPARVVELLDNHAQQLTADLGLPVSRTQALIRLVREHVHWKDPAETSGQDD